MRGPLPGLVPSPILVESSSKKPAGLLGKVRFKARKGERGSETVREEERVCLASFGRISHIKTLSAESKPSTGYRAPGYG